MRYVRIFIIGVMLVLLAAAFVIMLSSNISTAQEAQEKKGEDSDPPEHGDWIIDSTGNYIGNYTVWASGETEHDDSIKVDGNITIKDGGELTLFNTTINMTDHNSYHIIIEENGTLIMQNMSIIKNGVGAYIGYLEINGTLDAEEGSNFDSIKNIFINSTSANINISGCTFGLLNSFHITMNMTFDAVFIYSEIGPALMIKDSNVTIKRGFIFATNNVGNTEALHAENSNITIWKTALRVSSNSGTAIYLKDCNASLGEVSVGNLIKPMGVGIYAENSNLYLNDTKSIYSGVWAIDGRESTITMIGGRVGSPKKWYVDDNAMGGLHFENSNVLISNIIVNRTSTHAISIDSTELEIYYSDFWNISRNLIDATHSTILVEDITLSHVDGDAFHLVNVSGEIINCTFTEDYFPGYGNGTKGYGIFSVYSELNITSCDISVTGMDAIHARDSRLRIEGNNIRSIGRKATTDIHGIYLEDSYAFIRDNQFNGAYGGSGFDLYAVDEVPLDVEEFIENNTFNDGRIYHQDFTIHMRVVNETGAPVFDAVVNLTDNNGSNRKLSNSGFDGWTAPFTVQAYEIFRYTGYDNQTNTTYENFTNITYNDYHLIVSKEYTSYGFSIVSERDINISHTMELDVQLNVSTSDLKVKTAGSLPTVLRGEMLQINVVLQNLAEGTARNVNISYYYAINDTRDWVWFGSHMLDVPGIFDGGGHMEYVDSILVDIPIGSYDILIVIDPENEIAERNETNNNYTLIPAFEVITLPRVTIDHPLNGEFVNGTVTISGTAEDDYGNSIQSIELYIDDQYLTVSDITPTTGVVLWSFSWDTTLLDASGGDRYPNGPHNISVRCRNSNIPGYDMSEWFNISVVVVNIPQLHFKSPEEGEFVNITLPPIYTVKVMVDRAYDLSSVTLFIDEDEGHQMTASQNMMAFTFSLDTQLYSDGYHTLRYVGRYGYGEVSGSVSFLLNSPAQSTMPVLTANYELEEEGLTITGGAADDYEIQWVKIRLDDGPWRMVNHTGDDFDTFHYFYERSALTPDTHIITLQAYDGFDVTERELIVQVDLIYDLTIKSITLPEGTLTEGDWVNFTVIVENTGYYASPEVSLILYIGTIMRTVEGISVPANSQKSVEVSWHARAGEYQIAADINPSMKNDETNATNNHFEDGSITVEEKTSPAVSSGADNYGNIAIIAVVVAGAIGIAGIAVFLMNKKKM